MWLHLGVLARVCNAMNKFVEFNFPLWWRSGHGNIIRRDVLISAYISYICFVLNSDLAIPIENNGTVLATARESQCLNKKLRVDISGISRVERNKRFFNALLFVDKLEVGKIRPFASCHRRGLRPEGHENKEIHCIL